MALTAVAGDLDRSPAGRVGIDLYWFPLGAAGNFVRFSARVYEAVKARLDHRLAYDLFHSGLEVLAARESAVALLV